MLVRLDRPPQIKILFKIAPIKHLILMKIMAIIIKANIRPCRKNIPLLQLQIKIH